MGSIGCVRCEKSLCDFMAWTFALMHQFTPFCTCSYEALTNACKHYTTQENMSLGSNGVDWMRSLRKIRTWLRGMNFCFNCTSSHRFAPSFMQLRNHNKFIQTLWNTPKHYATHQNMCLGSNGVDWMRSLRKIPTWHLGKNFRINCTSSPCFASSFM